MKQKNKELCGTGVVEAIRVIPYFLFLIFDFLTFSPSHFSFLTFPE